MVDGYPTDPLRRDNMSFGGDDHGDEFSFAWDQDLMDFGSNNNLTGGDLGDIFDNSDNVDNHFVCSCHQTVFTKKADLNRHIAKETKRFVCDVARCPSTQPNGEAPVFGTLNDKKRHYRDVHGTDLKGTRLPKYPCPWTNCKRHSDGFPRPKNLENHLKSIHENKRPESSGDAAGAPLASPALSQPLPQPATAGPSTVGSSAVTSFVAPSVSNAPLASPIPAALTIPALAHDSTFSTATDSTPADSQQRVDAGGAPLPPLTEDEAADPVVNEYTNNINSLRALNASQSLRLATIEGHLVSMQADCNTIKQKMAESTAIEQHILGQLAKRKETIRAGRTINAQRRRQQNQTTGAATTAVGGAPVATPQNE